MKGGARRATGVSLHRLTRKIFAIPEHPPVPFPGWADYNFQCRPREVWNGKEKVWDALVARAGAALREAQPRTGGGSPEGHRARTLPRKLAGGRSHHPAEPETLSRCLEHPG